MIKQNIKYFLWFFLFFLSFVLFNAWKNEKNLVNDLQVNYSIQNSEYDTISKGNFIESFSSDEDITIQTNLVDVKINPLTGDFLYLSLKKYSKELDKLENIVVFDKSDKKFYYGQTGVFSDQFFDKIKYDKSFLNKLSYNLTEDSNKTFIVLKYEVATNVFLYKVYTFKTYSYEINVDFYIQNFSVNDVFVKHYGLINFKNEKINSGLFTSGISSYEGGAIYTEKKPYKKLSFNDVSDKKFSYTGTNGWLAFIERYFIATFIPDKTNEYIFLAENLLDNIYSFKYLSNNDIKVSSSDCTSLNTTLFVGPKSSSYLNNLAAGLNLTIDYGIFWPIASPIFFILNLIFSFVKNWGYSIILVTFLIKLIFFNLSSISYTSMKNMKKLQPKLDLLKEQYKDDKAQFGSAVINLYKKENVNPLSGFLPILIQIPVFISLYYVLLESIELRHSPFIFWINDLSSKDAYYILPVLMSLSMFIQQKLNPPIQDKLQAKVMMFLPLIFLFLFLQFPAGLMLYWIVNNFLSILQQWVITRK